MDRGGDLGFEENRLGKATFKNVSSKISFKSPTHSMERDTTNNIQTTSQIHK